MFESIKRFYKYSNAMSARKDGKKKSGISQLLTFEPSTDSRFLELLKNCTWAIMSENPS